MHSLIDQLVESRSKQEWNDYWSQLVSSPLVSPPLSTCSSIDVSPCLIESPFFQMQNDALLSTSPYESRLSTSPYESSLSAYESLSTRKLSIPLSTPYEENLVDPLGMEQLSLHCIESIPVIKHRSSLESISSASSEETPSRFNYPPIPDDAFVEVELNGKSVFACTFKDCTKSFSRKGMNSKSHWYTHFNIMPFSCKHCGTKFTRKTDCKRHEKTHIKF